MPNGGPTPDCVHCKFFQGKPYTDRQPHCTKHDINLVSPIYVFCSSYIDPEPDEKGDWLDQMLETREDLRKDHVYLWLGGYEIKFFPVLLAPISDYAHWTTDIFFEEMEKHVNQNRDRLGRK